MKRNQSTWFTRWGLERSPALFDVPWQYLKILSGYRWRLPDGNTHYSGMLLTRHYNQRPFDEIVCDGLIANGDVKNPSKWCKTFAMADTSNTVHILITFAMRDIRLIHKNCLWRDRTTETGSYIMVCAIHGIQFTQMNYLRWASWTQMIRRNKMCVIPNKQVGNQNCVRSL